MKNFEKITCDQLCNVDTELPLTLTDFCAEDLERIIEDYNLFQERINYLTKCKDGLLNENAVLIEHNKKLFNMLEQAVPVLSQYISKEEKINDTLKGIDDTLRRIRKKI